VYNISYNPKHVAERQWLEVGGIELNLDNGFESIYISAQEVEPLLPEAKKRFKEKAIIDNRYRDLGKDVSTEGNIKNGFLITYNL
jgi:hypothetical protein